MKHTIQVNKKNTTEHIIQLDQYLPINITKLPNNTAYKIHNTPIITTTTQTLKKQTIQTIRQKNKNITEEIILLIIENTTTNNIKLLVETIKENPLITIHQCKQDKITRILQQLLKTYTPETNKPVTTHDKTLYHDNTAIKTYKNKEYLQLIKEILNTNKELTLQQAEYQAQKTYYQYISYDKTNHNYKITINQKTYSTHKKLTNAIQERNIQTNKTEPEEETLCQNNITTLEPLPPTPWNNRIHNIPQEHNKYKTRHKTRHNNPDTINIIHQRKTDPTTILKTQKPDRNLNITKNLYKIIRIRNKREQQYYETQDIYEARYIRDKLEQHSYDKTIIPYYEQQYKYDKKEYQQTYKKQYHTIDYYQNTTTKLKQTTGTKEKYQRQQINKNTNTTRHQ